MLHMLLFSLLYSSVVYHFLDFAYIMNSKRAQDPYLSDHIPFYEYFHGDAGRGMGALHQTGSTGLRAKLLQHKDLINTCG